MKTGISIAGMSYYHNSNSGVRQAVVVINSLVGPWSPVCISLLKVSR